MKNFIVKYLFLVFIIGCKTSIEEKYCGSFRINSGVVEPEYCPIQHRNNSNINNIEEAPIFIDLKKINPININSVVVELLNSYKINKDSYMDWKKSLVLSKISCSLCKTKFHSLPYSYIIVKLTLYEGSNIVVKAAKNTVSGVRKVTDKMGISNETEKYEINLDYYTKYYCLECADKESILQSKICKENKILILPFLSIENISHEINKTIAEVNTDSDIEKINKNLNHIIPYAILLKDSSLIKHLTRIKMLLFFCQVNKKVSTGFFNFEIFNKNSESKISVSNSFVEEVMMREEFKNFWLQSDLLNEKDRYNFLKMIVLRTLFEGEEYIKKFEDLPKVVIFGIEEFQELSRAKNAKEENNKKSKISSINDFNNLVNDLVTSQDPFYNKFFTKSNNKFQKNTENVNDLLGFLSVLYWDSELKFNNLNLQNIFIMKKKVYIILRNLFPDFLNDIYEIENLGEKCNFIQGIVNLILQFNNNADENFLHTLEKFTEILKTQDSDTKFNFLLIIMNNNLLGFFYNEFNFKNDTKETKQIQKSIKSIIELVNFVCENRNFLWILNVVGWVELSAAQITQIVEGISLNNVDEAILNSFSHSQSNLKFNNNNQKYRAKELYDYMIKSKLIKSSSINEKKYGLQLGNSNYSGHSEETIRARKSIWNSNKISSAEVKDLRKKVEKMSEIIENFQANNNSKKINNNINNKLNVSEINSEIPESEESDYRNCNFQEPTIKKNKNAHRTAKYTNRKTYEESNATYAPNGSTAIFENSHEIHENRQSSPIHELNNLDKSSFPQPIKLNSKNNYSKATTINAYNTPIRGFNFNNQSHNPFDGNRPQTPQNFPQNMFYENKFNANPFSQNPQYVPKNLYRNVEISEKPLMNPNLMNPFTQNPHYRERVNSLPSSPIRTLPVYEKIEEKFFMTPQHRPTSSYKYTPESSNFKNFSNIRVATEPRIEEYKSEKMGYSDKSEEHLKREAKFYEAMRNIQNDDKNVLNIYYNLDKNVKFNFLDALFHPKANNREDYISSYASYFNCDETKFMTIVTSLRCRLSNVYKLSSKSTTPCNTYTGESNFRSFM